MEAAAICFFPALERQAEGAAQLILDSILPLAPTSIPFFDDGKSHGKEVSKSSFKVFGNEFNC